MIHIWKRYFFKELLKVFFLFLACFYFLYSLIDLSAHTKVFQNVRIVEIFLYYLCQFTQRADILIPFALLIGTIKVLSTLNMRNEIVALVVSGIPLKSLLQPFFLAATICATLLFFNYQWLQPLSLQKLNSFEDTYFSEGGKDQKESFVHHLFLKDSSLLVYNAFDPMKNAFFDVLWVKSVDDIYRIKFLYPHEKTAKGEWVDHLIRSSSGTLIKEKSYELLYFAQMEFEDKSLYEASHPPRWQSISQLATSLPWKQLSFGLKKMNDREAQAITCLYYKLLLPFVCFLSVMGAAPFLLRFKRSLPVFFIYALSLFGMIAFFTLVNSSVILGESQVLPPAVAVPLPFLVFFSFFGWKYAKI